MDAVDVCHRIPTPVQVSNHLTSRPEVGRSSLHLAGRARRRCVAALSSSSRTHRRGRARRRFGFHVPHFSVKDSLPREFVRRAFILMWACPRYTIQHLINNIEKKTLRTNNATQAYLKITIIKYTIRKLNIPKIYIKLQRKRMK